MRRSFVSGSDAGATAALAPAEAGSAALRRGVRRRVYFVLFALATVGLVLVAVLSR